MGGWKTARTGLLIVLLVAAVASPVRSAEALGPLGASSTVFPIHGDVYPQGLFYVEMNIGNPPKRYFLDIDTGSDLTWVQCDAPCVRCSKGPHPWYKPKKNNLVSCKSPLCVALHSGAPPEPKCNQCDYEIQYSDRGSSLGVLVADTFALRLANTTAVQPVLAFGCGYDQQYASQNTPQATDGVLGLGTGKVGVLSQLRDQGMTKDVVGHCLSSKGGGYLFFGADLVPNSRMTWRPMSRIQSKNYYSPGPANLYWGNQPVGVRQMEVVLDTGSTFSYFESQPYQALLSAVKTDLLHKPLKEFKDPALPVCWKGPKPLKSVTDVKNFFKPLALSFVNGSTAPFEIPPENYLIVTKDGNVCLGILNGTEIELDNLNVIGDISLQDLMVVYDNEKQQIGWAQTACKGKSKAITSSP